MKALNFIKNLLKEIGDWAYALVISFLPSKGSTTSNDNAEEKSGE